MFYTADEVRHLKQRIATLENENRLLRERLAEVDGSRAEITAYNAGDKALYDPNQGARIKSFEIRLVDDSCEHFAVIEKKIVW